jgi:hypothetical protein
MLIADPPATAWVVLTSLPRLRPPFEATLRRTTSVAQMGLSAAAPLEL